MKIDAAELRADADAHAARLASSWWTPAEGEQAKDWMDSLVAPASPSPALESAPRPRPTARGSERAARVAESQPRLEAIERAVETLPDAMNRKPIGGDAFPGWLSMAAGNPHTYDSPDATRKGVCARILPGTYDRLRLAQHRLGLRTTAGAWEFLLMLGLAAAERLPTRSG